MATKISKKDTTADGEISLEQLNDDINGEQQNAEAPAEIVSATIFKFGFPFHKACSSDSLRPAMNFIRFSHGFLICTDGNIMVKVSLEDLGLSDIVQKDLEGYYLHRLQFAMIWNKECEIIDGHVTAINERVEAPLQTDSDVRSDEEGAIGGFPDIDDVIRNLGANMGLKKIGLSGSVANTFFSIFKGCQMNIDFYVRAADSYMLKVTFPHRLPNSEGYLMPLIID